MIINIKGLEKHLVLKALYDNARPLGFGILHFNPDPMSEDEAKELIKNNPSLYFDYNGRPVKVDLNKDEFDSHNYDRDNPSAQAAIDKLVLLCNIDNKSTEAEVRYNTWVELYDHNISDIIVNLHNKIGDEGLNILCKFINDKFDEYYKPFKEFFSENKEETD